MTKESGLSISDLLTVVVPSKNEGRGLWQCLLHLYAQNGIEGTRIIVADSSDDQESIDWLERSKTSFKSAIRVENVEGGTPARARRNGAVKAETKYVLFLDADMMLTDHDCLRKALERMESGGKDLLTVTVETEEGYNHLYKTFYLFQIAMRDILRNPFALGGFQLWEREAYERTGGWVPEHRFAEDFHLSRRVRPERMHVMRTKGVRTSARRFKERGSLWMVALMLKTYLNRNREDFYLRDWGWWDQK